MTAPPLLDLHALSKRYGARRGIDDVSLAVHEGEVFGFLGPNGAGKTTTLRLIMGFLRPDSGQARVAGLDCWRDPVAVKRVVGYLPTGMALDPGLTGGQLIEYLANLRGGHRVVDPRYVAQLAERFGLDLSRKFRQYSHGNKQKVGIVQAFMHRPRLLLLDEPTSGLDPLNQQEFANLVHETRAAGRTVFLSSHVLSEVEDLCDRVAIIREGSIVHVGPLESIRTDPAQSLQQAFMRLYLGDAAASAAARP